MYYEYMTAQNKFCAIFFYPFKTQGRIILGHNTGAELTMTGAELTMTGAELTRCRFDYVHVDRCRNDQVPI
jgi:hypothetical protein